ncbi:hypothetical protein M9R32_09075 [Paenisporosarcina quisquiliarum]|uniref:Uncharacterized protein n=1 Tax=Paenisporosarcina quisquiliarum TaxID=365346 RepID=A0A9X3RD01_9BACL|nr:hypothetical protein [Paenisporosarcina quisquiliarum]MCZ8537330.1 hypothetical protein [Paenisporosarcina quisquiliarum]
MNKVMFTVYESYNNIFNDPLKKLTMIFRYIKVTSWKNRLIIASMPASLFICLFLFVTNYYVLSAVTIFTGYLVYTLFDSYLKHDILQNNAIHKFKKNYDEEVAIWIHILEYKLQLSLTDLDNILILEEIVRNEIENVSRKKSFGTRMSTSIQIYLFPVLTFLGGILLSRSITLEYLDIVILGTVWFFLLLAIINVLAQTIFDFSSLTKLRDILSLLLEHKLRIISSQK